ncbi:MULTISPECIES: ammonium transporter [unclassified Halomonas]|uniref:ammonium transporter n=1 Tax=unclassified Halomonas TaxID=2609666 RepID=UPI0005F9E37C|nr:MULTISPECIES: ammonium transporter [unclassified Halomonas]MBR9880011.1 ammonium transporter [Gammaproteobacteria bacterium]KJZ08770.1 ammonium transporter [Halomonas sp. S2151]MAR73177.1 ammonium transporter [Halomonas sp.]MCJ8284774.1 ammonium transporter [Halomonas sp.]NQY69828.1 ammonium transporter [Halomonas sp.]|tara:strand:+ start:1752 stop:3002 length:1251 start_codon:yes stop_codon:yes gene_type:complete
MVDISELSYALDTFYFLICGALVMWMAAGFAMLEAGLVRAKNTAEILTKNIVLFAVACTMYLLVGYALMYSSDAGGFIPNLGFLIGAENSVDAVLAGGEDAPYYSARADFFFQVVFVATAMSIVSGAVAERMKLWAFLAFAVVMTAVIYPVSGYWTWGGGWLSEAGFSDYAGSGIVHMAGAAAALAGVLVLGPRKGKYGKNGAIYAIPGANMPLATLGTFVLWLGWFGFNGGSELKLSDVSSANNMAQVLVNTNAAAAGGVIAALILAKIWFRKADLTMALNGAIAGLVSITADPLSSTALGATLIGAVGGILVVVAIVVLDKLRLDDPVGAISAHGVAGIWGVLAVPLNNADATFGAQMLGIIGIFAWVFIASLVVWLIIKAIMGVRVSEEEEYEGVDLAECGLEAYPEFNVAKK